MMCLYDYKRLVIQNLCKRSRCLEENPVFLFFSQKKINEKEEFSPSLQVGFSIVDLKLKELSWFVWSCKRYTLLHWKVNVRNTSLYSVISHAKKE